MPEHQTDAERLGVSPRNEAEPTNAAIPAGPVAMVLRFAIPLVLGALAYYVAGKMATQKPADPVLGLRVERSSGQLFLSWNTHAKVVQQAKSAVLSIQDGAKEEHVALDLDALRTGSIAHRPLTPSVTFRLEVTPRVGSPQYEELRTLPGRLKP